MKRILSVAALAAVVLSAVVGTASARAWRINNVESRKAHFLDINAACASEDVQDGDTLYLDPACALTTTQNVTKRLTIIGTGYFFTNQPYQPATLTSTLNLRTAGIKVVGLNSSSTVYLMGNNITLERCKAESIRWDGTGQNATLRQCWLGNVLGYGETDTRSANCTIENCMIISNDYGIVQNLMNPFIRNNYIASPYKDYTGNQYSLIRYISNGLIVDNIFMRTQSSCKNNVFYKLTNTSVGNNVLSCDEGTYTQFPDNVCLGTHEIGSLFTCNGSNDRYYEQAEGSPALSIEAGPFFGPYPYVFSGFPRGIPHYVESIKVSSKPIDGKINVTLKAKLQDE